MPIKSSKEESIPLLNPLADPEIPPTEREEISRGIATKQSIRSIAPLLSRAPSTVSREIRRNGGLDNY